MNGLNDRRLEVFIGATRRDLKEARTKVQEAVLESASSPESMGEFWLGKGSKVVK